MFGIKSTLVAALLLFGISMTQCHVHHTVGVCRPDKVDIFPIDYTETLSNTCWEVIYVTDSEIYEDVDQVCYKFIPNGNGTFTGIHVTVYKNGTVTKVKFYSYFRNNIVFCKYTDTVTGELVLIQDYPIHITCNGAALVIMCSCEGGASVDTRIIAIPGTRTITNQDIRELKAKDNQHDFKGTLVPLPRKLKKVACC